MQTKIRNCKNVFQSNGLLYKKELFAAHDCISNKEKDSFSQWKHN